MLSAEKNRLLTEVGPISGVIEFTNAPRWGSMVTSPSRSSAMIASRTGMRLTPSVVAISSWGMRRPGRSSPSNTSERM